MIIVFLHVREAFPVQVSLGNTESEVSPIYRFGLDNYFDAL